MDTNTCSLGQLNWKQKSPWILQTWFQKSKACWSVFIWILFYFILFSIPPKAKHSSLTIKNNGLRNVLLYHPHGCVSLHNSNVSGGTHFILWPWWEGFVVPARGLLGSPKRLPWDIPEDGLPGTMSFFSPYCTHSSDSIPKFPSPSLAVRLASPRKSLSFYREDIAPCHGYVSFYCCYVALLGILGWQKV